MNLGVNYGMRIARPGIGYLNPYVDKSQTTQITYGNPQLSVEKSHNIQLVYNMFSTKFSMNVTLGEYFCNNGISQYSFLKDGIQNITYGNVMRSRWTNLNTYLNWAPSTKTRIMANLTGDYGDMRSDVVEARNHGWPGLWLCGFGPRDVVETEAEPRRVGHNTPLCSARH